MLGLEYLFAAHLDPVGLFGWMFVLESLGAMVGGSMASSIDRTLGLNGKGMYFLSGHAQADSHHAEDLYALINTHLLSAGDRTAFDRMHQESLAAYCAILDNARDGDRASS